ncbi:claudin superfamily protein pickel [Leptinotarsa decemlineata]|uniref:claudin superfamily protein pickel n=1 Tax=Leptinotarsa decemlineata TaxID=7539 RepID=UPI000C253B76|nr:lens fiber membrane intrinsic protein [Leptinotarsa decemlineata]
MTLREGGKNNYPKASSQLVNGALLTYLAGLLLMMAFCSPYWVQSYDETFSEFKHMGLWEYCFDQFRYPYYQFDHLFDGCHHVFSQEFYVIREWLLPPWLMATQSFVTMAFLLSFGAQVLMALQLCRWPLEFVLQREWILSAIDFACVTTTTVFMFLAIVIFAGSYERRDWLMYPNFNHLSWSYAMGVLSFFLHGLAAIFLYKEAQQSYERRRESKNLIMQMHPNPQHRLGWNVQ